MEFPNFIFFEAWNQEFQPTKKTHTLRSTNRDLLGDFPLWGDPIGYEAGWRWRGWSAATGSALAHGQNEPLPLFLHQLLHQQWDPASIFFGSFRTSKKQWILGKMDEDWGLRIMLILGSSWIMLWLQGFSSWKLLLLPQDLPALLLWRPETTTMVTTISWSSPSDVTSKTKR